MTAELHITVREMPHSAALDERIREKVVGLERVNSRITSVRVAVEAPHRHHAQGNQFTVRLDVVVPGGEIAVNRDHAEDVYVALRDAFQAVRRLLIERSKRAQGADKAQRRAARGGAKGESQ